MRQLSDAEYVSLPHGQFDPRVGDYYWVRLPGFAPEVCRVMKWSEGRVLLHTTRSMAFIVHPDTECELYGPIRPPEDFR